MRGGMFLEKYPLSAALLTGILGVFIGRYTLTGEVLDIACDCPDVSSLAHNMNTAQKYCLPEYATPFEQYFKELSVKQEGGEKFTDLPLAHKWADDFQAYDNIFGRYRGKDVLFMEVGVQSGGSALMWRWYFGEKFRYIGIDINPAVQQFKAPWATILIGDSGDPEFWAKIRADYPERPDIFLDDGGHTMTQQLNAFKYAYDWVKDDGIYACEDLHTSYMPSHGGKLYTLDEGGDHHPVQHKDTSKLVLMTDLIKNSVDYLHAQRNNNCGTNEVCKLTKDTLQSISLSESIVFYQKGPKSVLVCKTGGRSIPYAETDTKYEDMFMDDMLAVAQEGTGGACETGNRASMWKPRPGYEKMKSIINR